MNKTELEATVCEKTNISRDVVGDIVDSVIETICATLKSGNSVKLTGFATISAKDCAARMGKNPKTGEVIKIDERRKVTIKAGKYLNEIINS